ncbi:imidazolonepropionase [bacterium]|nr:imidazolonepropionase [bacterium]
MRADILILGADELLTLDKQVGFSPVRGKDMGKPVIVTDGAVAIEGDRIVACGSTNEVLEDAEIHPGTTIIDASGKLVLPGFVDAHTHSCFVGTREDEFELRNSGVSYMEIARRGGGINRSVEFVRQATFEELLNATLSHLDIMLEHGTTTVEVKSGYGLSVESEMKMLEVIKEADRLHPVDVVPTFLGAHEVPPEFAGRRKEYLDLVISEMLPEVKRRSLARFVDIFCEEGVFDIDDSRRYLKSAKGLGFGLKLHADEMVSLGGAELAVEVGAISADHLVAISNSGIEALASSNTIPVLLPGTTFFLGLSNHAPARRLIEAGAPVAIATDFNPGSNFCPSMPMMLTLACVNLKMTVAEAITAATINAAFAIGRGDEIGSITVGKKADILVLALSNHRMLPYRYGVNPVLKVIKSGKVVVDFEKA